MVNKLLIDLDKTKDIAKYMDEKMIKLKLQNNSHSISGKYPNTTANATQKDTAILSYRNKVTNSHPNLYFPVFPLNYKYCQRLLKQILKKLEKFAHVFLDLSALVHDIQENIDTNDNIKTDN